MPAQDIVDKTIIINRAKNGVPRRGESRYSLMPYALFIRCSEEPYRSWRGFS